MLNQSFPVKDAWLVWHLLNSQPRFPGKLSQSFPLRTLLSLGWQISSSYASHALAANIQQGCRNGKLSQSFETDYAEGWRDSICFVNQWFCFLACIFFSLWSTWHELESSGKRNFNLENSTIKLAIGKSMGAFYWFIIVGRWTKPHWAVAALDMWSCVLHKSRLRKPWGASQKAMTLHCHWFSSRV